jgi:CheY-like chemotaxis protein
MAFKILAVDKDADALRVIKEAAGPLGHEVVVLNSGLEAANQVNCQKFDGAFIGASLPHMDGFAVTQLMRSSLTNRRVPIVMLTDSGDAKTMRKAFAAGVTFLLNKPLDLQHLQALLGSMRGQMLNEKRRYVRLPVRTMVYCHPGETQSKTLSVNVSQSGMLLEASGGLKVGHEEELLFELPDTAGQLSPIASVVRKEPNGRTAVRFAALSPRDRKALSDFVAGIVKS